MRLVFLYVADGPAPAGSGVPWDCNKTSDNFYAQRVKEEGYFYLLSKMIDSRIVDDVLIIIESNRNPGRVIYSSKMGSLVIPEIAGLTPLLRRDDVIWCRGGFRSWHNFLAEQAQSGRWLLIYAANTGREKWPFWDIIFDDLAGKDFVDRAGRIHLDFRKPTRPDIFRLMDIPQVYDMCIGASRIHDKKGQWRLINVAMAYKRLYGRNLKCVLPGPWAKGERTNRIKCIIDKHGLNITVPGNLARRDLARVMNQSKIFAHLGSHGQGDRSVMEAMRCGCFVIIGFPQYHAPWVWKGHSGAWVPDNPEDYESIARKIHALLLVAPRRQVISNYHQSQCGFDEVILPRMDRLFSVFREHPKANRDLLREEYGL